MNLKTTLEQYGLKERHAQIFIACLELGSAPIQKISIKSGYARSTCEAVLESLQKHGWVSSFRKKSIKYFSAEDPHKVIQIAKSRADLIERALPDMMQLYGRSKIMPTVRFYPGKEGMKLVLEEILAEARLRTTELLSFASVDDMFELFGKDFYKFVQKRVEKKVNSRVILYDSPKAQERIRLAKQELRDVRLLSPEFSHHGLMFIWGKHIAMLSLRDEFNMLIIESEELAQTQRMMFEALWKQLPKPNILN